MRTVASFGFILVLVVAGFFSPLAYSYRIDSQPSQMSSVATHFVGTLDASQKSVAVLPLDSPRMVDWHFIPKDDRKGLELNKMSEAQRSAAHDLLSVMLSDSGYLKATRIMQLENLLDELKKKHGGSGPIRDPLRYYFTVFGTPSSTGRWGLSVEGHHLSLNFVVDGNHVVSSTPQALATNPAIVRSENGSHVDLGTRILRLEETLAFELVQSLSPQQLEKALISKEPLTEVRAPGSAQPPQDPPVGIRWKELSREQQSLLQQLIREYANTMPEVVAYERLEAIRAEGMNQVHFAWAGATQPGIGHYYRIQGPTFLVEFVNTQPDGDGNIANHVHCLWRDMRGDFGRPLVQEK